MDLDGATLDLYFIVNQVDILFDADALFAGGELAEEDMDAMMLALQQMYIDAKTRNRAKYTPEKFRQDKKSTGTGD